MRRLRKRGHILRLDGAGRIRIKLAKMIEEKFGCVCDPNDIANNISPSDRLLDVARWNVFCMFGGVSKNVASWDRMSDVVKNGIAVVDDDGHIEVCADR